MPTPVIHFSNLNDLVNDFGYAGATIRVATSQRTETRNGQHFPRKIITVAVNVTALNNGCILSYMPFARNIEISVMSQHEAPSPQEKFDQAWKDAERIAGEIRLAIRASGHEPFSGRFDLGGVEPAQGEEWK